VFGSYTRVKFTRHAAPRSKANGNSHTPEPPHLDSLSCMYTLVLTDICPHSKIEDGTSTRLHYQRARGWRESLKSMGSKRLFRAHSNIRLLVSESFTVPVMFSKWLPTYTFGCLSFLGKSNTSPNSSCILGTCALKSLHSASRTRYHRACRGISKIGNVYINNTDVPNKRPRKSGVSSTPPDTMLSANTTQSQEQRVKKLGRALGKSDERRFAQGDRAMYIY
jgi:hypothetical protein